jgi:hypothetical protein
VPPPARLDQARYRRGTHAMTVAAATPARIREPPVSATAETREPGLRGRPDQ